MLYIFGKREDLDVLKEFNFKEINPIKREGKEFFKIDLKKKTFESIERKNNSELINLSVISEDGSKIIKNYFRKTKSRKG